MRGRHTRASYLAMAAGGLLVPGLVPGAVAAAGAHPGGDPGSDPGRAPVTVAAPATFRHPGVLVSRVQLDNAKRKVQQGSQPWTAAYGRMRSSSYASLSRTPKPRATVECGPRSNPNRGCSDEREDALAAYTQALLWYITEDRRHAAKAIQLMDAWSGTIKNHTGHNAPLQTGWSGASWARAGEIVRHTGGGWSTAAVQRFERMLRTVYLPVVIKGSANTNGNWELIMTDAAIGIAVFLEDRASFDTAVATWRGRVPAYLYLTADGALPKPPPGGNKDTPSEIIAYWHGQRRFVDGLAQETCRDFGHTGWGIAAAAHVAETAWHQGVDLYTANAARLTATLEFHADYQLGRAAPSWLCGGDLDLGVGPTWEVPYNHYHERVGRSLPLSERLLVQRLRPAGASHFLAWETLTHAGTGRLAR
jgi:Alginate lyase